MPNTNQKQCYQCHYWNMHSKIKSKAVSFCFHPENLAEKLVKWHDDPACPLFQQLKEDQNSPVLEKP